MTRTAIDEDLLLDLLAECEEKVRVLTEAQDVELAKPVWQRHAGLLTFLDKERSVYAFGVSLLTRLQQGTR